MIGIYKITSPSGKVYIGQTRSIIKRKSSYRKLSCAGQPRLYASLQKYGFDAHHFDVIITRFESVTQKELDFYEILAINSHINEGCSMLNIRPGGHKYGAHTSETRKKISAAVIKSGVKPPSRLGIKMSEDHKAKLVSLCKIRKKSKAQLDALSRFNNSRNKYINKSIASSKAKVWVVSIDNKEPVRYLSMSTAAEETGISKSRLYCIFYSLRSGCRQNKRTSNIKVFQG